MKVLIAKKNDTQVTLEIDEFPLPVIGPNDVLVKVRATALNRADLLQKRGLYPPPAGASEILGLECAGEISQVGEQVQGRKKGDRVCALVPGGGYAEYAVVPDRMLLDLPETMSYEQAAAIPEAFFTAYLNLLQIGHVREGDHVLVHSGASGVGTAAIQIVNLIGAHAVVTVGSAEKSKFCRQLGADLAINYREKDFLPDVLHFRPEGFDIVLDTVGGRFLGQNLGVTKFGGRIIVIGLLGGARSEIDLGVLLSKNIQLIGSTLRNKPIHEKIQLCERFRQEIWPHFKTGRLVPVIDRVYSWEEADAAHFRMAANENFGKIVLQIQPPKS